MTTPLRTGSGVGAVLVGVLALEAIGLRSGTTGIVLVGVLAAIALLVFALRVDLDRACLAGGLACAFTITWNGWFVGPVRPGDVLIAITLILLVLANPRAAFRTPPWWVKALTVAILLVAIVNIYAPVDPGYYLSRIVLTAEGQPTVSTKGSLVAANLGVAFKFVVAVAAIPLACTGLARIDRRAPRWLGIAFAAGAGLSGFVATLDHFGTDLGRIVTGLPNASSRQLGFAYHPNFLAAGLCLAAPFAFWLLLSRARNERLVGAFAMAGCVGGVYASGSRGGAVCIVLVIGISVLVHRRSRAWTPTIALAGAVVAGVLIVALPSVGRTILRVTRLAGNPTTAGSDSVRAIVGAQGVRDFLHSPIHGIGLQVSFDASQVYLQELASGGLLLFTGMTLYMLGAIVTAARWMHREPLAAAALAALLVTVALNFFEADLTDRFYYFPAAVLIALVQNRDVQNRDVQNRDAEPEPELVREGALA